MAKANNHSLAAHQSSIISVQATQSQHTNEANQILRKYYRGDGLDVQSTLQLIPMPKVLLSWGMDHKYREATVSVFHSTTSFCPDDDPPDLNQHGRMIVESARNGNYPLSLAECTHYFTFVLRMRGLFSRFLERRGRPLRFSIEVPAIRAVLDRLKAEMEFRELEHKIRRAPAVEEILDNELEIQLLESQRKLDKARKSSASAIAKQEPHTDPVVSSELKGIYGLLDTFFAQKEALENIKQNPKFQKLSEREQNKILQEIEDRLDPGEIRARQERNQK